MTRSSETPLSSAPRSGLRHRLLASVAVAAIAIGGAIVGAAPAQAVAFAISGTITDADTGLGIENVKIELYNQVAAQLVSANTDANGDYVFDTVPVDGNYTLNMRAQLAAGNYASMYYPETPFSNNAVSLALTNTSNLVIDGALEQGVEISGNVTFESDAHTMYLDIMAYNYTDSAWQGVANAGSDGTSPWTAKNILPGFYKIRYTDVSGAGFSYPVRYYASGLDTRDAELVKGVLGSPTENIDLEMTLNDPSNVVRLAGQNRFETSARIAHEYGNSNVVFVANGLGYPDALSAAPAAAFMNAPLLLTQQGVLPAEIKEQIVRLNPTTIYVIGGTGVVSAGVFNELNAITPGNTFRLAGANRYATSMAVFETIWADTEVTDVFLADGRNFPDALSSASAAAELNGPVVLVNGAASTLTPGLDTLLDNAATTNVVLAGGTAVLSAGIEAAANDLPGVTAARYFGANRYETSVAINNQFFGSRSPVFLAVGTGYADALAGAALAGGQGGPLYLVPGNCVPSAVLSNVPSLSSSRIVLLGGTGVLSADVQSLTSCTPID